MQNLWKYLNIAGISTLSRTMDFFSFPRLLHFSSEAWTLLSRMSQTSFLMTNRWLEFSYERSDNWTLSITHCSIPKFSALGQAKQLLQRICEYFHTFCTTTWIHKYHIPNRIKNLLNWLHIECRTLYHPYRPRSGEDENSQTMKSL